MKPVRLLLAAIITLPAAVAQQPGTQVRHYPPALEISRESHHSVLFQNDTVRVFRLSLNPGEATAVHQHDRFYAYLSLQPLTIATEVRGRQPILSNLEAAEVRTSKGGFAIAERNESTVPANLIMVESLKASGDAFTTPLVHFRYHDAAFGPLFESPTMRAYEATVAVEGRTEPHSEPYDRLILAITDLKLHDVSRETPVIVEMKAGEVRWFARGPEHATTNIGPAIAKFITLEFN